MSAKFYMLTVTFFATVFFLGVFSLFILIFSDYRVSAQIEKPEVKKLAVEGSSFWV